MKKILLVIFSLYITLSAQQKEPQVELPDFVITGDELIIIQKAEKPQPDYISTLSDRFTNPSISTDELSLAEFKRPKLDNINLSDTNKFYNSQLILEAGVVEIPFAKYTYQVPFELGYLTGSFNGRNVRPYVNYSDKYSVGGDVEASFFTKKETNYFPSTNVTLNAGFNNSSYKFYRGSNPLIKRQLTLLNVGAAIKNLSAEDYFYGLNLSDNYLNTQKEKFSENNFNISGFTGYRTDNLEFGGAISFFNQTLTNDSTSNYNNYLFSFKPNISLYLLENFKAQFGFNYQFTRDDNYFSPYIGLGALLYPGLSLFLEYAPDVKLFTYNHFLKENEYVDVNSLTNIEQRTSSYLSIIAKYEYKEIFEISSGLTYSKDDNSYFYAKLNNGKFNIIKVDANRTKFFGNLILNKGKYGKFVGGLSYNIEKSQSGAYLPYIPKVNVNLEYEYDVRQGLAVGAGLIYKGDRRTFQVNTDNSDFNNLYLFTAYNFSRSINLYGKISNILNNKNYTFEDYRDYPFNISAGLNIRW